MHDSTAEAIEKNGFVLVEAVVDDRELEDVRSGFLGSSSLSVNPKNRRVLHLEFANQELPQGLKWAEGSGLMV